MKRDGVTGGACGTVGEWLKNYGTLLLSIGTGVGYLVGYGSVAVFAATLDVSSRDLGLDLRDYLVLTLVNAGTWAVWFVGGIFALTPLAKAPRRRVVRHEDGTFSNRETLSSRLSPLGVLLILSIAAIGTAYITLRRANIVTFGALLLGYFGSLALVMFIVGLFDRVNRPSPVDGRYKGGHGPVILEERPANSGPGFNVRNVAISTLVILVASSAATIAGSAMWAADLKDWAGGGRGSRPAGPPVLELLMQPEMGNAVFDEGSGSELCVIRVGPKVYLGASSTIVQDAVAFYPEECDVDWRPSWPT